MRRKPNAGSFKKGNIPWNKNKYGYMGSNRTSFTHEQIDKIGAQRVGKPRFAGDYLCCLCNERRIIKNKNGREYAIRKRVSYPRWLLEQHGITLRKNEVVYHIDGDLYNNDITNLEVITRAELMKRNSRRG